MPLGAGTRLGSYEILSPLGAGGMGEVYRARHLKLEREVAIKVLPHELASDPERLHRFEREARAASALNHPSIVTIYDIDEHEGTLYIAMELVEGRTLRELLADGPLPSSRTLPIARQVAEGLAKAHAAGIVHRDLKPDNVMVTDDGLVKILDFGLAKRVPPDADFESEMTMMSRTTAEGAILGTVPYMSPEQAAGRPLDHRSDQFSLGVVLYELLCGQRPFQGSSVATVLSAIMRDTPSPLRSLRPETPKYVEGVVQRCLEKDPRMRYASSGELARELLHCEEQLAAAQRGPTVALRRPVVAAVLALLVVVAGVPTWLWWRGSRARWAHEEALPEITRLTERGEIYEAYRVALEAKKHIPGNAELQRVLARITLPVSVVTDPPGARVFVKGYATPEAAWEPLGETPLEQVRIPYALMRWKISKEGFETFEGAPLGEGPFVALARGFPLDPVGTRPEGMVRVPGGHFARPDLPAVEISDYWLDRYEVTNRQFEKFVDAGAYRKREYWTQPFLEDGRELSWEQAIARFRDKTGRPGPSMWELGTHADAREDHPVGGVSWYEAAAYCTFAGGSLPTVYHWYNATVQDQISDIVRLSNFGGEGTSAVGSHPGLGDYGTYDMAGNVKEWCWNATGDRRYVLGGAWSEPTYMFRLEADARLPFERSATHGFRCARFPDPLDDTLLGPVPVKKHGNEKPVTDEVFEAYRRMYAYDRTDLAARVEAVDDSSPHWRKETVSFDAAYGNERVSAHLFLPRSAAPPYQAVVWFPGNDAFFPPSSQSLASAYLFDFIPRSGRVLVYPVYKGMYERRAPFSRAGNDWRDMVIMWSKDLGRTLDYLKTREDVDHEKLAYYGFSLGSIYGPVFTAVDQRFRASVLLAGGLRGEATPEMAVMNFASRSRVPTLMVSGMDDFILPLESAQRPLFRLLGAPEADKRHAQLEGGHIPSDRREIIREVLDWLDRYLGPVQTPGPSSTAG